jgi:hypothetical protein
VIGRLNQFFQFLVEKWLNSLTIFPTRQEAPPLGSFFFLKSEWYSFVAWLYKSLTGVRIAKRYVRCHFSLVSRYPTTLTGLVRGRRLISLLISTGVALGVCSICVWPYWYIFPI